MDQTAVRPALALYKQALRPHLDQPKFLVWGSFAAGTNTPDSDLDVVVVSDAFGGLSMYQREEILFKTCLRNPLDIDPWGATWQELELAPVSTYIGLARETGVWALLD